MKILYELQTPWPTDLNSADGIDGVDWTKHGEIPFVPSVGMHIDCGDGDLRVVREVYWSAEDPGEISVYFEDDVPRALSYWTRGGWQTGDLNPAPPSKNTKATKSG